MKSIEDKKENNHVDLPSEVLSRLYTINSTDTSKRTRRSSLYECPPLRDNNTKQKSSKHSFKENLRIRRSSVHLFDGIDPNILINAKPFIPHNLKTIKSMNNMNEVEDNAETTKSNNTKINENKKKNNRKQHNKKQNIKGKKNENQDIEIVVPSNNQSYSIPAIKSIVQVGDINDDDNVGIDIDNMDGPVDTITTHVPQEQNHQLSTQSENKQVENKNINKKPKHKNNKKAKKVVKQEQVISNDQSNNNNNNNNNLDNNTNSATEGNTSVSTEENKNIKPETNTNAPVHKKQYKPKKQTNNNKPINKDAPDSATSTVNEANKEDINKDKEIEDTKKVDKKVNKNKNRNHKRQNKNIVILPEMSTGLPTSTEHIITGETTTETVVNNDINNEKSINDNTINNEEKQVDDTVSESNNNTTIRNQFRKQRRNQGKKMNSTNSIETTSTSPSVKNEEQPHIIEA